MFFFNADAFDSQIKRAGQGNDVDMFDDSGQKKISDGILIAPNVLQCSFIG